MTRLDVELLVVTAAFGLGIAYAVGVLLAILAALTA